MATRIIEYGGSGILGKFPVIPADQKVTEQAAMTATSTSTPSSAFNAATALVIIDSDEAVHVAFGPSASVAATANSFVVKAGSNQAFSVQPGWAVAIKS